MHYLLVDRWPLQRDDDDDDDNNNDDDSDDDDDDDTAKDTAKVIDATAEKRKVKWLQHSLIARG